MGEFINSLGDFCLHTGESHCVVMCQIGKLLICTANRILGASEELFSKAKLMMKINVHINTKGYYKGKEHDSPVKIGG